MTLQKSYSCKICGKTFDVGEYALHIQEEQLIKLRELVDLITDVKDAIDLTYEYMKTVEDEDPINVKDNINDNGVNSVNTDEEYLNLTEEERKEQDAADLLLTQLSQQYMKSVDPVDSINPIDPINIIEPINTKTEEIKTEDTQFDNIINSLLHP